LAEFVRQNIRAGQSELLEVCGETAGQICDHENERIFFYRFFIIFLKKECYFRKK